MNEKQYAWSIDFRIPFSRLTLLNFKDCNEILLLTQMLAKWIKHQYTGTCSNFYCIHFSKICRGLQIEDVFYYKEINHSLWHKWILWNVFVIIEIKAEVKGTNHFRMTTFYGSCFTNAHFCVPFHWTIVQKLSSPLNVKLKFYKYLFNWLGTIHWIDPRRYTKRNTLIIFHLAYSRTAKEFQF